MLVSKLIETLLSRIHLQSLLLRDLEFPVNRYKNIKTYCSKHLCNSSLGCQSPPHLATAAASSVIFFGFPHFLLFCLSPPEWFWKLMKSLNIFLKHFKILSFTSTHLHVRRAMYVTYAHYTGSTNLIYKDIGWKILLQ